MPNLTHRWTGQIALAANSDITFKVWYTDVQVIQATSYTHWAVSPALQIPADRVRLQITQQWANWVIDDPDSRYSWWLTVRSDGDRCDFIVDSIMVEQ
ncbi:hypothetical protein [Streptomyces sp. NPDC059080]|uniref:hypothetical protein n=1 Tax=Streptomyces sp. NPDC059080 TaxID=3346718 RepID=UPI00369DA206